MSRIGSAVVPTPSGVTAERLDVYRIAAEFQRLASDLARRSPHPFRDQLERASLSIVLNIAEGYGRSAGGQGPLIRDRLRQRARKPGPLGDPDPPLDRAGGAVRRRVGPGRPRDPDARASGSLDARSARPSILTVSAPLKERRYPAIRRWRSTRLRAVHHHGLRPEPGSAAWAHGARRRPSANAPAESRDRPGRE
jgi:hypothetical protein